MTEDQSKTRDQLVEEVVERRQRVAIQVMTFDGWFEQANSAYPEPCNRPSIGPELRMIELKREVNQLSEELGKETPYDISFAEKSKQRSRGGR